MTAPICLSAENEFMPSLVIFLRKKVNQEFMVGKPAGSTIAFNLSGYMTSEIFPT